MLRTGSGVQSPEAVTAVAALEEPNRLALYRFVVAHGAPVGRDEAAAALGIPHHIARFHLDRLEEIGLLEVEYKRPGGRSGPGAGRPAKLYRPASTDVSVSVPERRYDLAGLVLSRAVASAIETGSPVADALEKEASAAGRAIGQAALSGERQSRRKSSSVQAAVQELGAFGYAVRPERGGFVLGNCPFRALSQESPEVVCRMNFAFIKALLRELGAIGVSARFDPADGRCCVSLQKGKPKAASSPSDS